MISKDKKKLRIIGWLGISIILITSLLCILFLNQAVVSLETISTANNEKYDKHYMMITENTNSMLLDEIYKEIKEEAQKYDVYVEYLGKNLSRDYGIEELLRIAIGCNVDGIILEGNESEQVVTLINEATKKGIPVITVLKDSPQSNRECFVGVNNYDLGQMYAKEVLKSIGEEAKKVLVLMNTRNSGMNQNIIYSSLMETLQKDLKKNELVDVEKAIIDSENTFGSEELIRNIIMDTKNLPDMIICLNEEDTKCAYQAIVDYNMVGEINILGYYHSKDILMAIEKEIIYSTITIDAKQMGQLCIQALNEYKLAGRTSDYTMVNIELITLENVRNYLKEPSKDDVEP